MINFHNVSKIYHVDERHFHVLKDVSFSIGKGEFVAIMGMSGSGKSTLLHLMGLLDKPTSGTYKLNQIDVQQYTDKQRAKLRNAHIGFVFQQFHLLPRLTAFQNIELPLIYRGDSASSRARIVTKALEAVGLIERKDHYPNQLSGGQKQRIAIARAMVTEPYLVLADEPTGALDTKTGEQIMDLFRVMNDVGTSVIVVTHELAIAECADRILVIRDGALVEDRGLR
ncbi:ABC transporter ATP-binding protein [Paenibacillus sp. FSL W8-0186]|uniref:ABC transporter ATP-binding protein YknY n=1 Tax=Paenibacillus woosongensis TaxID=307580 RepID=A0A7X3CQZ5_9BACL|nr:ABC transporter ATP-binding protein [Paenibacillus woosongensis]MUG47712.1 ATP-binding cassette domain-containing protein [Paenibacillus woosongensis]GIP59005.1 putative ABC transporter ATP-binding protein YknY [Paenibacillus woosongensis]